jgi:hypothetical protein
MVSLLEVGRTEGLTGHRDLQLMAPLGDLQCDSEFAGYTYYSSEYRACICTLSRLQYLESDNRDDEFPVRANDYQRTLLRDSPEGGMG